LFLKMCYSLPVGLSAWSLRKFVELDEARKLVEEGFEYVTDVEGNKLFRKRK